MVRPSRNLLALVLAVLAAVATVAAVLALYLRFEVAERDAFADRAAAAFDRPEVRRVAAREVVVQLIDRGSTDLVAARPVLEGVVEALTGTPPFQRLVRAAAAQSYEVLFERDDNSLVFDLADVSTVVLSGVRSVSPDIARRVPDDVDARLIDVRERDFAGDTLEAADTVRRLALWAPILAVLLLAGALALAADRRRALTRYGLALGMAGIVAAVALSAGREVVVGSIEGTEEIPKADLQSAVGGVWDSFLGDLRSLIMIVALVGFVLASSILTVAHPQAVRERLEALTRRPAGAPLAALRGVALLAAGVLVLVWPQTALALLAYVAGAALVYLGSAELLRVLGSPRRAEQPRPVRRLAAVVGVAALTAVAASMTAALVLQRGQQPAAAAATPAAGCNGMKELCGRRVNDVLFPGTHNAMSAADVPGWALANQRRSVPRQLEDGIRLFLLDPHYGRKGGGGRVLTDFAAEGRDRNKVARELDPPALAAARRLGPSPSRGTPGPRDVWLCHTLCELGATRFTDTLNDMKRFLAREPQNVLVLFLENYVTDEDLAEAFRRTGTQGYAQVLDRGEPLPTLGQMIGSGKRLLVFTENRVEGIPWLNDGFEWVQDTPLKAERPDDLNCRPSRGDEDSPILMLNHWIDRFPPPLSGNRKILRRAFLTRQIGRCEAEREMPASFVAVDYYDQGALIDVARRINRSR
ncbi:MAG TPA: hypothetical protein VEX39_01480 [Thermoleophilaceae bacterium]|nr:hypothetical protein [Thermoleophilaceae bacterium]